VNSKRTYSILVVGCGSIGRKHALCFKQLVGDQVVICDSQPELARKLASEIGVHYAPDVEFALRNHAVRAAVVCTPAHTHVQITLDLLKAGIHVLVEKPLATSLVQIEELVSVHSHTGLKVAVAYVYRFFPYLMQSRNWILQPKMGRIGVLSYVGGQPFHRLRPAYEKTYYRSRATGGGAIQDALTHITNWAESIVGAAHHVKAIAGNFKLSGVSVEDTACVIAQHKHAISSYCINQFQPVDEGVVSVHAEHCNVVVEIHRQRWGTAVQL